MSAQLPEKRLLAHQGIVESHGLASDAEPAILLKLRHGLINDDKGDGRGETPPPMGRENSMLLVVNVR
jgi:hypothetical protein